MLSHLAKNLDHTGISNIIQIRYTFFEYQCINIFKPKKHNIFKTYPNLNLVIAIKIP